MSLIDAAVFLNAEVVRRRTLEALGSALAVVSAVICAAICDCNPTNNISRYIIIIKEKADENRLNAHLNAAA